MTRPHVASVAVQVGAVAAITILVALVATGTAVAWDNRAAYVLAGGTTLLLCLAGARLRATREREAILRRDLANLADANLALERARAEADRKSAQMKATLAGMTDGVAMIDADMRLVEWNDRFPEIAGVPRELLRVGLPLQDILRSQAMSGQFGTVDIEAEVVRRSARLQAGLFTEVSERLRPDGRVVELRRNRLPDGGFVTLYSDITARKQAENALHEAHALAAAETTRMSHFVAIVSHEIRTPLAALLNALELLAGSEIAPAQQALVDTARRSGDALLALINDILEMSRMETGQLALRPSVFALRPLLQSALQLFAGQATERRITLRLSVAHDVPEELFEDPGRLRQVLINLLSNAVKFAAAGEVRIAADTLHEDGRIALRLVVHDRGPIIPEDARARLFQPFSRLGEAGEDVPLGTGLGLTICRHLISLMGGEIGCAVWTMGGRDAGNEFWITLPLKYPPADAEVLQGPVSARGILPRTRILLVEDILANQAVTATLLRREGHLVDVASSGEEAVRAAATRPYDLIFMDIFMPGMSGLDTARRIRDMWGPAAKVPIIALTANVSSEGQALCSAAGMNGMLGKPVAVPQLLETIARHVWPHRLRRSPATLPAAAPGTALLPVLSSSRLASLRAFLPVDRLTNLIEDCLVEMSQRLGPLQQALEQGIAEQVRAHAHAMAGMAAEYGMATLESRFRALMHSPRSQQRPAAEVIDELAAELARTAAALRSALQDETV